MGFWNFIKKAQSGEKPLTTLEQEILRFWTKKKTDFLIPDYYVQTEFGRNVEPVRVKLLKGGYLEVADIQTAISLKTVPELKAFLKANNLSTSGSKAIMIERILASFPERELNRLFPVSQYRATEKGEKALNELRRAEQEKSSRLSVNDCFTQQNYAAGDEDYRLLYSKMVEWSVRYLGYDDSLTENRQRGTLRILMQDPTHDLYKLMSFGGNTCPFCAPREGRVYSRSGRDPVFPPLALAFEKIDKKGPDVLWNTYLVTHPNTRHSICPWTPAGRNREELEEIIRFSSLKTNPLSHDPRTPEQVEAYRKMIEGRGIFAQTYYQYECCSKLGIEGFPKTFQTFDKHKRANSEKYQGWMRAYNEAKDAGMV